jgi:4-hydroxy-3-methylbut-2-enyl diphosphate reductase
MERFRDSVSRGFDPSRHLENLGIVNQTTMLASESREIAQRVAAALRERDGAPEGSPRFRDFDTICPATQDNQDAVIQLSSNDHVDVFLVLGGYDSSNTRNLLRAARARRGSYHIQSPDSIDRSSIRHRDPATGQEVTSESWLPDGDVVVGLSAGASTPDTELAAVIDRICAAAGVPAGGAGALARPGR